VQTAPSIGIALYPRDGQRIESLMTNADAAMYTAKSAGSGLYRFYDASLNAIAVRGLELLGRFRQALKDNEFCLLPAQGGAAELSRGRHGSPDPLAASRAWPDLSR
jgi:predicted signal transduction protein with EAL and GGDEF domain